MKRIFKNKNFYKKLKIKIVIKINQVYFVVCRSTDFIRDDLFHIREKKKYTCPHKFILLDERGKILFKNDEE